MGRIFAFIYGLAAYFIGIILYAIGFVAGRRALARDSRLQRERAQLHVHALPDHLLRDIGVSRCEFAGATSSRSFWTASSSSARGHACRVRGRRGDAQLLRSLAASIAAPGGHDPEG
jgi:uncharacterized protein YjiS (DUF1127 family)